MRPLLLQPESEPAGMHFEILLFSPTGSRLISVLLLLFISFLDLHYDRLRTRINNTCLVRLWALLLMPQPQRSMPKKGPCLH
ncbi:hypothetical protein BDW71DRAFT_193193 [Aspergillus fruticulosus]